MSDIYIMKVRIKNEQTQKRDLQDASSTPLFVGCNAGFP